MNFLAIDPGEKYCGVATKITASTKSSKELLSFLRANINCYDIVVVEEFRLYPWTAKAHVWSNMPVCKLIGKIEYICEENNIRIIYQPASIKKLPFVKKIIKECGLKFKSQHEKDAYMHLVYYLKEILDEEKDNYLNKNSRNIR